jgi:DNA anti-recombination protein RmuC
MNVEICEENKQVKITLKEQILDEKLNILKIYKDKLDVYFNTLGHSNRNRLLYIEARTKDELLKLKGISEKELGEDEIEIAGEIEKLNEHIQEKIKERKTKLQEALSEIVKERNEDFDKMADEEITEEVIQKRIKNNNIENKIGSSLINKIGILLIIIGASTALKYTYSNFFTNEMKGILVFPGTQYMQPWYTYLY